MKKINKKYRISNMNSLDTQKYTVFVLDNDECIGAWGLASGIHQFFVEYISVNSGIAVEKCVQVLKTCMIKYYLSNGGARPGTKETLKMIKYYKDIGLINKVVMFTSANNKNKWVEFLKDCLEDYAQVNGLYDLVLHRDNTNSRVSDDGATIKSLDMVKNKLVLDGKNTKIIMFDDKPQNIEGTGVRIGVSPYRHVINANHLDEMIDKTLDILNTMYKPIEGKKTFPPIRFVNILKNAILFDKSGRDTDVNANLFIHNCPVNQLDDTNLIKEGVKAFMDHLTPQKLVRSTSNQKFHPPRMKRSRSY
jgi:hypothetical protein